MRGIKITLQQQEFAPKMQGGGGRICWTLRYKHTFFKILFYLKRWDKNIYRLMNRLHKIHYTSSEIHQYH